MGFEALRETRHQAQVDAGMIPADAPRTEWDRNPLVWNWDDLTEDEKQRKAREMATYAAMMESQDRSIGTILNFLRENDELDNTLIIYLSDNGPEAQDLEGQLSREPITDWVRGVRTPRFRPLGTAMFGPIQAPTGPMRNWGL